MSMQHLIDRIPQWLGPFRPTGPPKTVEEGRFVRIESSYPTMEQATVCILQSGGGREVTLGGERVTFISSHAPLAKAILGLVPMGRAVVQIPCRGGREQDVNIFDVTVKAIA